MQQHVALYVVYGNVILYSVCYMMQQPALPYLTDKLGASTAQFASLQSLFNGAQTIGGLLSGPALDAFGGKVLLLVSFAASIVCYGLTAAASSLAMLYLSRVATVLQHAVLAARSIVTTTTREEDRAKHLGYVGMCVGLGMSSGPLLGGLMSDVSLQFAAWMATAGSVVSFLAVLLFVPSDAPSKKAADATAAAAAADKESKAAAPSSLLKATLKTPSGAGKDKENAGECSSRGYGIQPFLDVFKAPGVRDLMTIKITTNMAMALFQGMMTVVMKGQGLAPKHVGAAMSLVGVVAIVVQGLLVAPATGRWGESRTQLYCCWGLLFGFVMLATAKGFLHIMLALIPMSVTGILLSAVTTARLTKMVPKSVVGTALSLDMGLWSAVRMVAPVLGAQLLVMKGAPDISAVSAAIMAALLGAIHLGLIRC